MNAVWSGAFKFKGRIARKRYWIGTLTWVLGGAIGGALLVMLAALNYNPPDDTITARTIAGFVVLGVALTVLVIAVVAGLASTGIRRLHDRGKTGWWLMLYYFVPHWLLTRTSFWEGAAIVIPLAGAAILVWAVIDLGILPGEPADNAYGPPPGAE